jgi:hypothetical protein
VTGKDAGEPLPNIAIVAVHGVADQAPHTSARAMANLLLGLIRPGKKGSPGRSMYTSFREYPFRIPLQPIPVAPRAQRTGASEPSAADSPYREQALRRTSATGGRQHGSTASAVDAPEHTMMRRQLVNFDRGDGEQTYETVRLEGQALLPDASDRDRPATDIHIYEMYWADLTRLGENAFRVFGELYQLLLNVAGVGRHTLTIAADKHPRSRKWQVYERVHAGAVWILTRPVPLLNLVMATLILAIFPLAIGGADSGRVAGRIAAVVIGLGIAILASAVLRRTRLSAMPVVWIAGPVVIGTAIGGALWAAFARSPQYGRPVLLAEWIALSGAAVWVISKAYDRRRPGALRVGMAIYAFMAVLAMGQMWIARDELRLSSGPVSWAHDVVIGTFGWLWAVLVSSWFVLSLLALSTFVLRWRVWKASRPRHPGFVAADDLRWVRIRRATRIAAGTLALPATLLMLLTLTLWSGVYAAGGRQVDECGAMVKPNALVSRHFVLQADSTTATGVSKGSSLQTGREHRAQDNRRKALADQEETGCPVMDASGRVQVKAYLEEMVGLSGGPGFIPTLVATGIALFIVLWALLPVVWTEIRAPRIDFSTDGDTTPEAQERTKKSARAEAEHAQRLGEWLTHGLRAMPFVGALLFWGIFAMIPLGFIVGAGYLPWLSRWFLFRLDWTTSLLLVAGGWIAASTIGLLALRGRLDVLALGFRPAIDIALDVESYLRLHPRDRTPRARIAERYISLLRHLCSWRSDAGKPYDAIVIVAHSQGSVITADLLGFLQREMMSPDAIKPDDGLRNLGFTDPAAPTPSEIPLYFFTMGSPLRQLYSAAFPHQYEWVEGRENEDLDLKTRFQQSAKGKAGPALEKLNPSEAVGARHVTEAARLENGASPDPWAVRIVRWVNAYRSGDYVGRSLWRAHDKGKEHSALHRRSCIAITDVVPADAGKTSYFLIVSEDQRNSRRELCIGAGAHTHYWDTTAHDIAIELDILVKDGLRFARQRAQSGAPAPNGA